MTNLQGHILSVVDPGFRSFPDGFILSDPAEQQQARLLLWLSLYRHLHETARGRHPACVRRLIKQLQEAVPVQLFHPLSEKVALAGGRYYWRLSVPGFPSPANARHWKGLFRYFIDKAAAPRHMHLSVTDACPMAGSELKKAENHPALNELIETIRRFRSAGGSKLTLRGGEPMLRRCELPQLLRAADRDLETWLQTTGYGLTDDRARRLKAAGLSGLYIDLDYSHAGDCDRRRYPGAFDWALRAAVAAHRAGLVTCLNFHACRTNVTPQHLDQYLELAHKVGASFVQLLAPPKTGPVEQRLSSEQYDLLEAAYLLYNSDPAYATYPIVEYPGFLRRRQELPFADPNLVLNELNRIETTLAGSREKVSQEPSYSVMGSH